jgi:signal peptidase II
MGPGAADEDTQTASGNASPVDAGAPQQPAHPETAADLEGANSSGLSHLSEDELPPLGLEASSLGPGSGGVGPLSESAPLARPSFVFFGVVAGLSLAADIASKVWAEWTLNQRGFEPLELIRDHLAITLAYNRGGAWGLFATASDLVRKPFFLGVSIAAIAFIISLYARLTARQKALKWGLPLVLGGALGNLNDRITRSQVIDFIDYRADWIMDLNVFVHRYVQSWAMTDHWPTFNVADVAICVGVGLMAIDMFTHRPRRVATTQAPSPASVHPSGSDATMSAALPARGPVPAESGGPDAPPAIG